MIKRTTLFLSLVLLGALLSATFAFAAGGQLGDSGNNSTLTSGLVGYWSLDGNKINWLTGKVADSSVTGNTGQLLSMSTTTSPTSGKIAGALQFNSTTAQDISLGTAPAGVTFAYNQPFSISLWAKPSNTVSSGIFDRMVSISASSGKFEYFIMANTSAFSFNVGKNGVGDNSVTGSTFTVGQWYHLIGVYDGTNISFYINGVKVGTTAYTFGALSNPDGTLSIGGAGATSNTFNGSLDDVRIYNRALGTQEVSQLYKTGLATVDHSSNTTLASGLAGYWPLDGNTTNWNIDATIDASGNGNLGQLIGLATTTSPVAGKVGGALSFNGTNSRVQQTISGGISTVTSGVVGPSTTAVWFKSTQTTRGDFYSEIHTGSGAGYLLSLNRSIVGKFDFAFTTPTDSCFGLLSQSSSLNNGKWHYAVAVVTGTTASVYIDGALTQSQTIGCTGSVTPNSRAIGEKADNTNFFNGIIDDVRVYNRALSAAEVSLLYSNGTANIDHSNTPTSLQTNLVGYYTFDGPKINWATGAVLDSSGNNLTGSLISMSTSTSPAAGKIGQGLNFNGSSSFITLPTGVNSAITGNNISVAVWVKANGSGFTGQDTGIVTDDFVVDGNVRFAIMGDSDTGGTLTKVATGFYNGTWHVNNQSGSFTFGKWVLVVGTYDGSTLSLYINGALDSSTSVGASLPVGTGNWRIGNRWDTNTIFNGTLDDVRIYNRTLSASDVSTLYNMGR